MKIKNIMLDKSNGIAYGIFPKSMPQELKNPTAVLLYSALLDLQQQHGDSEGWFYAGLANLSELVGAGDSAIRNAIKTLTETGYLEQQTKAGAKTTYRLGKIPNPCENQTPLKTEEVIQNPCENQRTTPAKIKGADANPCENQRGAKIKPLRKSNHTPAKIEPHPCENQTGTPLKIAPHNNKEEIIKNNNKEEEINKKQNANLENSRSEQKKSKGQKIDPIEVQDLLLVLLQKYYPNQSKGWGDLLSEYLVKIKYSEKPKAQTTEQFLKNCQNDADRFLNYCSAGKIEDAVIIEYLELAISHAWKSLTKWGGKDGSNYTTSLASIAKRIQAETCKNSPKTNESPKLEVYAQKAKTSAPSAQKEPLIITEQMRSKRNSFCFPENRKEWVKNVNSELVSRVTQEDAKRLMLVKDPQKRSIFEHPEHLGFSAAEFIQQGVKNNQEAAAYLSKQLPKISVDDAVVLGRVVVEVFGLIQPENKADSIAKNQEIAQNLLANIASNTVSKSRTARLAEAF